MKINRGQIQVFSISFLDVLSCALGAIIILFVVVPKGNPKPEVEQKILQRLKVMNQSLQKENKTLKQELKTKSAPKKAPTPKAIPKPVSASKPTVFGLPLKAGYAVYVIDVSGSMDWQVNNLFNTIESLLLSSEVDKFRFMFFDSDVYTSGRYWKHGWLTGNATNKDLALRELPGTLNDLIFSTPAGTNSGEALYQALRISKTDAVYFITDGFPTVGETNTQRILERTKRVNRNKAVINSVMVGLPGVSRDRYGRVIFVPEAKPKELYDFLHNLAEQNNGAYIGR